MNEKQLEALNAWKAGLNVQVCAVPGAGKSFVLLEACKHFNGLVLILAYNNALCEETKRRIFSMKMDEHVACLTFHGLATYCIGPTFDDATLYDHLDAIEQGRLSVARKLNVLAIMIDEAQDFRPSFHRLMSHVIDTPDDVRYLVVGDERQMLYTYDEEDSADLKYLNTPHLFFQSTREWKRVALNKTHRLRKHLCEFTAQLFGVDICTDQDDMKSTVTLFTANPWRINHMVKSILRCHQNESICILVSKKKNNGPLTSLINSLYKKYPIYVHGLDGNDARVRANKLEVTTWHSSKGTEFDNVIVLGVNDDSESNPLYVACTRAKYRLYIFQDEENPNVRLMNNLESIDHCSNTRLLKERGFVKKERNVFDISTYATYSMDEFRLKDSGRWMRDLFDVTSVSETNFPPENFVIQTPQGFEDVSNILVMACLLSAEFTSTRKIRRVEDIITPKRLSFDKQQEALLSGSHHRYVSPNIPSFALLDDNEHARVLELYRCCEVLTPLEYCEMAALCLSWKSYHHIMHQCRPFDWFKIALFLRGVDIIRNKVRCTTTLEFDKRVFTKWKNTMLHIRVDAIGDQCIFLFVHEESFQTHTRACLCSAIGKLPVVVANVVTQKCEKINVSDTEPLFSRLFSHTGQMSES